MMKEILPRATEDSTGPHPKASWAAGANPVSISWKLALKTKMLSIGTRMSIVRKALNIAAKDWKRSLLASLAPFSSLATVDEAPSSSGELCSLRSGSFSFGSSKRHRIEHMATALHATMTSPTELRLSNPQAGASTFETNRFAPGPMAMPMIRHRDKYELTVVCSPAGTDRAT